MELRDIEIFLTLAEELHFGRTAERLHVSSARISQAIKKQERQVGADLFERTSRAVRLTEAGEQLRDDLIPLYRGLRETVSRARLRAAGKTSVLRVGMLSSVAHELRAYWDTFRERHPQWGLRIQYNGFVQPFAPLRNGEVDVLVWFLPVREPDLTVGPVVYSERKMLIAAADHELAERDSVSLEVYGDFPATTVGGELMDYSENEFMPYDTPRGRSVDKSVLIKSADEIFTAVSQGEAIHTVAAYAQRYHARPDIAFIPFNDADLFRWVLVWRSDVEDDRIRALAAIVRELGTANL
ncbi:LysR family transcriptional regulator [Nocardia sp. NPDC051030]|uniref:LysR family transcriptional regulator n=1 Tax=Nocardia sp. NPDC051030 TaxID=3155162 RepID=UPI0034156AEE